MVVEKKRLILIMASVIYFFVISMLSKPDLIVANVILGLSLLVSVIFIYDTSKSVFSLKNIFYVMFFVVGFYGRYLVILIKPDSFMDFAPQPIHDLPAYHTKTAIVILVTTLVIALAYHSNFGKKRGRFLEGLITEVDIFEKTWVKIVFFVLLVVSMTYRITNVVIATSAVFGTFDNLFNSISIIVQLLAYSALALYVVKRRKVYFFYYLAYFIPIIIVSILGMWKSTLLFEVIILCMAFHRYVNRVKMRYIVIGLFAALIIFPVISMSRDNTRYDSGYKFNIESIIDYNVDNNVFLAYSERMAYYDETYYCLNTAQADIDAYQEAAGGIVSRIFAGVIPRVLWKNKPVMNSGQYVTYILLHYPKAIYNNLTVGLISDCYISYSYLGIIIIMFIFSKFLVFLEAFGERYEGGYVQGVYLTFARVVFMFMEGDIASRTITLVIVLIAMIFLKIVLGFNRINIIEEA